MERRWFIALIAFACAWFVGRAALAGTGTNLPFITYEGYLEEDDGNGGSAPVNGTRPVSVQLVGKTTGACVLYSENFSSVAITDGHFTLKVGSAGTLYGGETSFAGLQESRTIAGSSCSFNPTTSGAVRALRITVDGHLMGDVELASAPHAMVADSVQGLGKSSILQVNTSSGLTQSALESFMQTIVGNSGKGVSWNGSSFVAYDPKDGGLLNSNSVGDAAISDVAWSKITSKPAALTTIGGLSCANGEIMKMVSGSWTCATESGGGGGGAESDPTVAAYAKNAPGSGLAVSGTTLVADFGTTAGKVAQGDDARFTNSRAPTGTASGDLGGSYPNPTVTGFNGKPIDVAVPLQNDFLTYDSSGVKWKPTGYLKLNRQSSTGAPQALVDTYLESYNVPFLTSNSDPTIHAAHKMTSDNTTSANDSYGTHFGALSVRTQGSVNSGITNPGGHVAGNFEAFRNTIGSNNDGGTLKTLLGGRFFIGHGTMSALSPVTQEAAGIEIGGEFNSGSVLSYKAIRISGVSGSNKPADANSYGIYQESQNMRNYFAGPVGVGTDSPSAFLHLRPGNTGAGQAQLKLTSGAMLATPESGAIEYNGTDLYFTDNTGVRKNISSPSMSVSGALSGITSVSNSSGNISLNPSPSNSVLITGGAASISSSTGALVVSGGVGVDGAINSSGAMTAQGQITANGDISTITSSTPSSSATNASSPLLVLTGKYYSSGVQQDQWSLSNILSTATTPTSTLKIAHNTGTSGKKYIALMDGAVGINTLTPAAQLHVKHDATIGTSQKTAALVEIVDSSTGIGGYSGLVVNKTGSGTGTGNKKIFDVQNAGNSVLYVDNYGTTTMNNTTTVSVGAGNAYVSSTNLSASPANLTVVNNAATTGTFAASYIGATNTANDQQWAYIGAVSKSTGYSPDFVFGQTTADSFTFTERMRIAASGNVGIGTDSPAQKLDVAGPVQASAFVNSGNVQLNATAGGEVLLMRSGGVKAGLRSDDYFETPKLRVNDGSQAVGKVLTSDGNGNATWMAPTGGTAVATFNRILQFFPTGNGTAWSYIGATTAPSVMGTSAANDTAAMAGIKYTSGATANYQGGISSTSQYVRIGWNAVFETVVTTESVSNLSYSTTWAGLFNGVTTTNPCSANGNCTDSSPSGYAVAAFRYMQNGGSTDTGWACVLSSTSAFAVQPSGLMMATSGATYNLRIETSATAIKFFIDGNEVCSGMGSINFPSATQYLVPFVGVRTLNAVARSITINRMSLKSQ